VHSSGIELLSDEIDTKRCAAIAGALLADPRLTDGHVVLTNVCHAIFRSVEAMKS